LHILEATDAPPYCSDCSFPAFCLRYSAHRFFCAAAMRFLASGLSFLPLLLEMGGTANVPLPLAPKFSAEVGHRPFDLFKLTLIPDQCCFEY